MSTYRMTDEQLAIARRVLENYEVFSDIAANMGWAKMKTKYHEVMIDHDSNLQYAFIHVEFDKSYVQEHFAAAFAQMMLTQLSLYEEWDPDKEWGREHTTPEDRMSCFVNGRKMLYGQYLDFVKIWLTERTMDQLIDRLCTNVLHDWKTKTCYNCELPQEALDILSFFKDAIIYDVGCETCVHTAAWNWLALKDSAFLYVRYFEGWS